MRPDPALLRAQRYLERCAETGRRQLVCDATDGIEQVVVIPALAEEGWLFRSLASLSANDDNELHRTLVICVVNNRAEPSARADQVADNQRTWRRLKALIGDDRRAGRIGFEFGSLRLGLVDAFSPGREIDDSSGVGEARRIGLDLGLSVLLRNRRPRGPLLWLDADTLVAPDYLGKVCGRLGDNGARAVVVGYQHPLPEEPAHRLAIVRYEISLRYHELGLRLAGSPYAFPTIGSTIAVRSDAYVSVGGMNRRQAGEDFYFLQQLAKTGGVDRIDSTTVYPSARPSDRVPFGTGASIRRFMTGRRHTDTVYNPEAYTIVGRWLRVIAGALEEDAEELLARAQCIDPYLNRFLVKNRFELIWPRLQGNARDRDGLHAQFNRWFDAFKTLKLIHFLRDEVLPEAPIFAACREVLERSGIEVSRIDWARIEDDVEIQIALLHLMRRVCAS